MEHIIKICKFYANTKLLIDAFRIFLKMCSINYIITKKAAFQLYLFQFFTVINNYKKRIIKVNQWITGSWTREQWCAASRKPWCLQALPQDDSAGAQSPRGNVLPAWCQCQAAWCALLLGQHWASSREHGSGSRSAKSVVIKLSINNWKICYFFFPRWCYTFQKRSMTTLLLARKEENAMLWTQSQ